MSSSSSQEGRQQERLQELEGVLDDKEQAVLALQKEVKRLTRELTSGGSGEVQKSAHPLEPVIHLVGDSKTKHYAIGRRVSMATASALEDLAPMQRRDSMARKMTKMFKTPDTHAAFLTSSRFALDLIKVCQRVAPIFEAEPRAVLLQSPVYVFGDIHGNLEDLNFFADNMWKLGMNVTAGKFLFLGDYVDRGMQGLECLAYLFSLKIENPDKMFMLRGNHELRDVNGWIEHYGERSFLWQCQNRFGEALGEKVWESCNAVFDRLPLAGVIDQDIFCVHGGIPRPLEGSTSRIQDIMCVPPVASVCPPNECETFESQQVASDCMWSDPAKDEQELALEDSGFGESLRGGGAICFGTKAIDDFLTQGNLSYIVRAHEAHSEGVSLSKGAKVFTVFSTSKDHGQGKGATCGCILVDYYRLLVINRSVKYKNKYVHRRDSMSLANLTLQELQAQVDLGLVVQPDSEDESDDEPAGYYDHAAGEDDMIERKSGGK
ncbi:conserved unknown protein [Ectocarpus siliculosus]|uniref:Serine/threonine-protein phosphatase n=1 Tax=Ectocarpus siliculosus TaxID=2880 RepID=D8LDX7_ECTSI|nr:conserved unknown protein [Ectocarpus siliculosus]|eukprot:CBN75553.1 conserved unknown protein [Ectocarpus siliculosus]